MILCKIFGHKFFETKTIVSKMNNKQLVIRDYTCARCGYTTEEGE